ncbi:MAG: RpiB/LacA/LacB family sugar-phosphate isomerase [Bacilli bacterium]|nr:RpiB/LacA/LacB family sugar-phosphate isomerase [Bacilli bacterium]
MKVAIASDHRGFELKKYIINKMKDVEFVDLGTNSIESTDYPIYAFKLGEYVTNNNCFGVAICGSGIGISIACNKVKGVRCARVSSIKDAIVTRDDNDSNIVAFSSAISKRKAVKIIRSFINEEFKKAPRHVKRINQINEYERSN